MPLPVLREPTGPLVPGVRRIAVLRANAIGDFVLALPALEALRAAYPSASLTYLGAPWHPQLLDGRPGPWDRVVVVPPCPGVRGDDAGDRDSPQVRQFLAEQAEQGYDLAVQLHGGGGNSNPFVQGLGARVSIGSRAPGAPPLDRDVPYELHQHEVHRFLEVVALAGATPVALEPRLTVVDADRRAADAALGGAAGPFVTLHPGATDARRRWPADRFAAVADALAARGAQVVLVGAGDDDAREAARIADAMRTTPVDLVGRLSLSATTGLLERSALHVGNDSGPRHLAAAVGTATVSVYLAPNLLTAGPLLRARHRVGVSFRTACPQCGADQTAARCAHDPSFVADVPVDALLDGALELYDAEAGRLAA